MVRAHRSRKLPNTVSKEINNEINTEKISGYPPREIEAMTFSLRY